MARTTPSDDGSPARLIATMVGIVGILLLGSLAWSAVGALFSAFGQATSVLAGGRPTPVLVGVVGAGTPAAVAVTPGTATPAAATPTLAAATPTLAAATPVPAVSGRAPWVLLPQPPPGTRVPPGPLVVEARGRGDAPISTIRLDLDGAPLAAALEQRSESTWRGAASTTVAAGHHAVTATVLDDQGRSGSYRWTFDAGP